VVACFGVILGKIWAQNTSKATFIFVYEKVSPLLLDPPPLVCHSLTTTITVFLQKVTLVVIVISGSLLICGWDMQSLLREGMLLFGYQVL
jgi:hypothetical protein